jgi:hypothetical protein
MFDSRVRAAEAVLLLNTHLPHMAAGQRPTRPNKATPQAIPDVNVGGASRIRGNERCVPPAPAPSSPCAGFSDLLGQSSDQHQHDARGAAPNFVDGL